MKKTRFIAHGARHGQKALLCLFAAVFALFICAACSDDGGNINGGFNVEDFGGAKAFTGTWDGEYAGEVYTINTEQGTFDSAGAYAGANMSVVLDTEDSGRFIIRYTRALIPNAVSEPYYSTDVNIAPDVGKWYAVYFRVINRNTIAISGGWKSGGPNAFDSATECRTRMTRDAGYFTSTSECKKRG